MNDKTRQLTLWDWSPDDCPGPVNDWHPVDDPPKQPGPTIVIYRRDDPPLRDDEFNAGHRTNIIDCGNHYYGIEHRWFNGKCWAGFRETVIMWQPLPKFPADFPPDFSKHMNPPEE